MRLQVSDIRPVATLILPILWAAAALVIFPAMAMADEALDSIIVNRSRVVSDLVTNHDHGWTEYRDENDEVVYSVDVTTSASKSSEELLILDEFDAGLQFLLEHGYPNKLRLYNADATDSEGNPLQDGSYGDEADFYATQAAVWWHWDPDHFSSDFKNPGKRDIYNLVDDQIRPLVQEARAMRDQAIQRGIAYDKDAWQQSVAISYEWSETPNSRDWLWLPDEGCYESPLCIVNVYDGENYTVSLGDDSRGVSIVDAYGDPRPGLPSGEGFRVRVAADSVFADREVVLSIESTPVVPTMSMYHRIGEGNYERMAGLRREPVKCSKEIKLTIVTPLVDLRNSIIILMIVACLVASSVYVAKLVGRADRRKDEGAGRSDTITS